MVNPDRPALNVGMVAEFAGEADADWEFAPLRIPADVSRGVATAQLTLQAEFGGWELARVLRYSDGSRRVWLRRKRRRDPLPLPGLSS